MRTVYRRYEIETIHGSPRTRSHIARRLWQRPARGVVVKHNGPLTQAEVEEVELCVCAPGAVLAGLTALERDGLTGITSKEVFVTLPEGARRPQNRPGVTHHWSTRLDDRDVHPFAEPRRTRPSRSTVDAASWATSDRQARMIVIAAIQQGLVATRTIREALTRRGPCRRRALIIQSVLDAAGGIQSLPERDFDELRRAAGLPAPARQVAVKGADGRYFLDVEWPDFGIAVEVHGIPHLAVEQWDADIVRANEVVIDGRRLLVFSSYAIRHHPDLVIDQLRRAVAHLAAA